MPPRGDRLEPSPKGGTGRGERRNPARHPGRGPGRIHGFPATLRGTHVHSVCLPGYVMAFETLFGLPHERLTIHPDAGTGPDPCVTEELLAVQKVARLMGMVRRLDAMMLEDA